jgi:hypothetical protein
MVWIFLFFHSLITIYFNTYNIKTLLKLKSELIEYIYQIQEKMSIHSYSLK